MSRFDWKASIVNLAMEIESSFFTQRMFPERIAEYQVQREGRASYAEWLARSYNRKGKRKAVTV